MHKKLINLIGNFFKIVFIVVLLIGACTWYINYKVPGETGFVIAKANVYNDISLKDKTYTLEAGETFSTLLSQEDDVSKIRYFDEQEGKDRIGFLEAENVFEYTFPDQTLNDNQTILLSVSKTATFKGFLKELVNQSQKYNILGVYTEEVSTDVDQELSQIEYFCDEAKIPHGRIKTFSSHENVQKYLDTHFVGDETGNFSSYKILPQVLCFTGENSYSFKVDENNDELKNCIFKYLASAKPESNHSTRIWLTEGNVKDAMISDISNSKLSPDFNYSVTNSDFHFEISDKYLEIFKQ